MQVTSSFWSSCIHGNLTSIGCFWLLKNLNLNLKHTILSHWLFITENISVVKVWFHWQHMLFFPPALYAPYVSFAATFIPVFSPNSGIHFSLHCGNWHSMVGAIVNMAVWDWYKEAPVTPQAKLVCEAGRGCCLLCWWSLCRFAVGPFLIAFSYTACRLALHI